MVSRADNQACRYLSPTRHKLTEALIFGDKNTGNQDAAT